MKARLQEVEAELNTLLANVTTLGPADAMSALQRITRQLQEVDAQRGPDVPPEVVESAKRLNFFREEIATHIVQMSNKAQATPPPVPARAIKAGRQSGQRGSSSRVPSPPSKGPVDVPFTSESFDPHAE